MNPILLNKSNTQVAPLNLLLTTCAILATGSAYSQVTSVSALVNAVNNGNANDIVIVGAGTFQLSAPLTPKAGMTIRGAGVGQTIITGIPSWVPATSSLPDPEISTTGLDSQAYLFRLPANAAGISISDMTLKGPNLHGAIYGYNNDNLHIRFLLIQDFLWCGIRTFSMDGAQIHDCQFIDAGGRWSNGAPGVTSGITGGAIFATWMNSSEIWNNRFTRTKPGSQHNFFGIKGRQGRNSRIHHNTINVDFSIEFPFENDEYMEIDHNICKGVISVPKDGGGPVPSGGYSFHIHHNYFTTSYAIEGTRNGIVIDHNLFDFSTSADGGNLVSSFGPSSSAQGSLKFYENLVKNPGRGVFWSDSVYNNLSFYNNHIKANSTVTPRTEGLFGFSSSSSFNTISIKDNIIECTGQMRPLVRNSASNAAVITNNTLLNVSGTGSFSNPSTGATRGLTAPLQFTCGVSDESTVDGWTFGSSEINIAASADAFTRNGTYASTNYGTSTSLVVKSSGTSGITRRSYVKFPVSACIDAAEVNLILPVDGLGTEGTSGFAVEVRTVTSDSWSESAINWNNQPASGSLISSFFVLPGDVGNEVSIDVTSFVAQQAAGDGIASFVILQPGNPGRTITFSSKEGGRAPRLEGLP